MCIEFILGLVNKKESLQRVNAAKIDLKRELYFILGPLEKRAHYVVESESEIPEQWRIGVNRISECRLRIADLESTVHQIF